MKERFIRFMYGRYGIDSLGKFTIGLGLVLIVLSNFADFALLPLLAWACIILAYFRMFSKNTYKRSSENQWYLNKTYKIRRWIAAQKNYFAQRKPTTSTPALPVGRRYGFRRVRDVSRSAVRSAAPHL